jgi:hypothetical protein
VFEECCPFQGELVNVEIKGKKGKPSMFVTEDEEYKKINYDKFTSLPTG